MMQQRSEETHAHILKSAYQLFSQKGYQASSVADICKFAGVSKGAFYHHFPSKQALFIELLENWLVGLDVGLKLARQDTQTVSQAILQMATLAGNIAQTTEINLSIILEFWTQASRDPAIWKTAIAPYRRYQEYFAALIQEGIDEGSFRKDLDPQAAARALVSLAMGLLIQAVFDPQTIHWEHEVHNTIQFMLQGVGSSL
jgi:AcrR family transcriptional regulator